ncbi:MULTISPECIES: SAM-dependent methyltransferase [unclassified Crossiella]|uniref:SAM-dependent methyltransferase n=1 Tax=unclassified Crossiella TaxID=2620835 RepID=UPI001FFF508F|nr:MULTISPECIES: SAM-dependent methyltransferase [unclassified Crossiella]MCK2244040.1 SAM-dependent methyltransferase [Crossiella sp. S99.2]MCK2257102.1 SAM-dependent methyltransferase [Crossiella sp. S99.1]
MAAPVDQDPFPPAGLNLNRPGNARVHDYLLGGTTNWAIDRTLGDQILAALPLTRSIYTANRLFLHRAVRHLIDLGVRQFVDIGSGLPTMSQTHEIAEELCPGAVRVVYLDHDPLTVAHAQIHLERSGDPQRHAVLHADLRAADRVWTLIGQTGVLDLAEPTALLAVSVLDARQPDQTGAADMSPIAVARYRELLATGSYLALSHATVDGVPAALVPGLAEAARRYALAGIPVIHRDQREIAGLFGDFELLSPGLTWAQLWRPEDGDRAAGEPRFATPNQSAVRVGVARKR